MTKHYFLRKRNMVCIKLDGRKCTHFLEKYSYMYGVNMVQMLVKYWAWEAYFNHLSVSDCINLFSM